MTMKKGLMVIPTHELSTGEWKPIESVITDYDNLSVGKKVWATRTFRLKNPNLVFAYANRTAPCRTLRLVFKEPKRVRQNAVPSKTPVPVKINWSAAFNSLVSMLDSALAENAKLQEALTLERERSRQFECSPIIEKLSPRARQVLSTLHNKRK